MEDTNTTPADNNAATTPATETTPVAEPTPTEPTPAA